LTSLDLDHTSSVPLHAQLEQVLANQIIAGQWKAGETIPSERDLQQMAGVSRATVRQAIGTLIAKGLLRRSHGRGTFVARPRIEQPLHKVYSFAEQIQKQGRTLEDRIIQRKVTVASHDIAAPLGIAPGESIIHIQRVRTLDGTPFTLDNFYMAQRLCPELLGADLDGSLYRLLDERFGLPVLRSTDTLEPIAADRATASYLQVPPGAALMFVERVGFTHGDLPLHVARNYVRGDMCRFRIHLVSDQALLELKPLHAQSELAP
jgi:GntR family transcriptional regulator